MSWRDDLRQASFRGVPFFVRAHETQVGRRVQVHEYPLRDKPYVEDLGRMARPFDLDAYVIGADYMVRRNALLRAVEQAGSGVLVHPYLGEMRCTVLQCRVRESSDEGGMARFMLQLVEAGEARFPSVEPSTAALVAAGADYGAQAVAASFKRRHRVAKKPAFVLDASRNILTDALRDMKRLVRRVRAVPAAVAQLNRDIDAVTRDIAAIISEPGRAAQALQLNLRQLVRSVTTGPRAALEMARGFYNFGAGLPAITASTTSRRAQAQNQAELLLLVKVTAATEAALAVTQIQFDSYDEATRIRDELCDVLDAAMLSGVDDDTFDALRSLRAAVVRDVAARGADLARLVSWTPATTMPAAVAAHRVYADATLEAELLVRNRIRHPLFVPGGVALEVLSDAA